MYDFVLGFCSLKSFLYLVKFLEYAHLLSLNW
jgi:hypothetical protein